jgi:D-aminopeptidase
VVSNFPLGPGWLPPSNPIGPTEGYSSSGLSAGAKGLQQDSFVKSKAVGVSAMPAPLNLPQWQAFPSGQNNAITDVPGLKVGQVSYKQDGPEKIRTGVTAIVPDAEALTNGQGNLATTGFRASSVCLNGNGELTGSSFINEFGVLNGPILLSNTRAVGALHSGVDSYFEKHYPGQWTCQLPVIGECYDNYFSTTAKNIIPPSAAEDVIQQAKGGPVLQGQVGAGTGMRSFELHAGIGSSSRRIMVDGKVYTIGVLVNMNHSKLDDLNPDIRKQMESRFGPLDALKAKDDQDKAHAKPMPSPRQGSIQVVIATDLPLNNKQLEALAKRAGLGIGNTGSTMATSSGDFATAFSTANPVPMGNDVPPIEKSLELHPDALNPIFKAAVEATTEAQGNALVASHS